MNRRFFSIRVPRAYLIAAAVCLTVLLGLSNVASACPSCQAALGEAGQGDLARGIYYSILFMMSMPFAIVGTFGGLMYRAVKREQRRQAELNGDGDTAERDSV